MNWGDYRCANFAVLWWPVFAFQVVLGTDFESLGRAVSQSMSAAGVGGGYDVTSLFSAGAKLSKAGSGLSEAQEYYLGRAVSARILSQHNLVKNQALQSYVQRVGSAVAAVSSAARDVWRVSFRGDPER